MATEVIKTIKSSGGDYSSLSAFSVGERRDLVTDDEHAVAEVYADWPSGLDDNFNPKDYEGWETDSTHRVIVRPADGQKTDGTEGSGFWLRPLSGDAIVCRILYLDVEGIEVSAPDGEGINYYTNKLRYVRVKDCVLHDIGEVTAVSNGGSVIENCIVYDVGSAGGGPYVLDTDGLILNCTLYMDGGGAYDGEIILRNVECYNTVIYNTTTGGYDNFYTCTGDYNASNDDSAPGDNSLDDLSLADIDFESTTEGEENLFIGADSLLIDEGVGPGSNSDVPTEDIIGTTRSGSTCDIGAYEYVATSSDDDLTATDVISTSEVEQATFGQEHELTSTDLTSSSEIGKATLSSSGEDTLTATDVVSTTEIASASIGQEHSLTSTDLTSTSEVTTASVEQEHSLDSQDILSQSEVQQAVLGTEGEDVLTATDVIGLGQIEQATLGQDHGLISIDIVSSSEVGQASVEQTHVLTSIDIVSVSEIEQATISVEAIAPTAVLSGPFGGPLVGCF